jgi:Kinesin motor domain
MYMYVCVLHVYAPSLYNDREVSGFVQSALDGFKISIFSYGQSGSGKTHSMTVSIDSKCCIKHSSPAQLRFKNIFTINTVHMHLLRKSACAT